MSALVQVIFGHGWVVGPRNAMDAEGLPNGYRAVPSWEVGIDDERFVVEADSPDELLEKVIVYEKEVDALQRKLMGK